MSRIDRSHFTARRWGIASLFAGGLLAAFVVGRLWPEEPKAPPVRAHSGESERTPKVSVQHAMPMRPSSEEANQAIDVEEEGAQEPDPAPPASEPPKKKAVKFDELQRQVQTEVRDSTWAIEVEARLRKSLEQDGGQQFFEGDVQVLRVDCGSIRCAVEAEAADLGDASMLGNALTRGVGLKRVRVYTVRRSDGGASVSLIGARKGYDIFGNERVLARVNTISRSEE